MGSYAVILSASENVTNSEYAYLSGLSSNIQTQINDLSNNVYSQTYVDTSHNSVITKITDLSNNVYSQSYIDDLSNNVYSQSYIDDLSNNVYSQTHIDTSHNSVITKITDLSNNVYSQLYIDSSYSYLNSEIIDLSNTVYGDRTEYKITVQNSKFYIDGHEQYVPVLKSGVTYTFDHAPQIVVILLDFTQMLIKQHHIQVV